MKNSKPSNFLVLMVSLGCFVLLHAQNKPKIYDSTLWLKSTVKTSFLPEKKVDSCLNYNSVLDFTKDKISKSYKRVVNKEASLFMVFKSMSKEENNLLALERGIYKATISNQKISDDSEIKLNRGAAQKGILLSYLYYKNSLLQRRNGALTFDDLLYHDKGTNNQLMELIYIPRFVSGMEKKSIESYLSIKYGVSLDKNKDYYNSKGHKIWDCQQSETYSSRVTGIGKDDFFELNQKQSGNSEKDGLYIGFTKIEKSNSQNNSQLDDLAFILWGDNDKDFRFPKETKLGEKKMERIWKIQRSETSLKLPTTQLVINKKEMHFEDFNSKIKDDFLWLAIDTTETSSFNYTSAKYIKASNEDSEKVIFDNIIWPSQKSCLFTFVKAPDFFIQVQPEAPNCLLSQNGNAVIKIIGGVAPYRVELLSDGIRKEYTTNELYYKIENLPSQEYILLITDARSKTKTTTFNIDSFKDMHARIAPIWYLNSGEHMRVVPEVEDSKFITSYVWFGDEKIISTSADFEVNTPGKYSLQLTNSAGCQKKLDFDVVLREALVQAKDQWGILPNPVKSSEKFSISFDLEKKKNVSVTIFDESGKMIRSSNLGLIQQFVFEDSLYVKGTFLVIVNIDGIAQSHKLIIH